MATKEERSSVQAAAVTPVPNALTEVSIDFVGMPEGSQVKVNGALTQSPLMVIKSSQPLTVTVDAKGYRTWTQSIVPDRDQEVAVQMEEDESSVKKEPSKKRKKKKKRRRSKRKSRKKKRPIAANPF